MTVARAQVSRGWTAVPLSTVDALLVMLGLIVLGVYAAWRIAAVDGAEIVFPALLLAGPVFLLSQVLRGLRLFFLCYDRRIRFGTVVSIHFLSSPVTNLIPFTLGELYRVGLLGSHLRDPTRALVAIWIERVHDITLVTAIILGLVLSVGAPIGAYGFFVILAACFLFLSAFVFVVLPENLGRLKRYLFLRWHHPSSLRAIGLVHGLHELFDQARAIWRSHWATVAWLSLAIWAAEVAWVALLLRGITGDQGLESALATFEAMTTTVLAWDDPPGDLPPVIGHSLRLVLLDLAILLALPAAWALARTWFQRLTGERT